MRQNHIPVRLALLAFLALALPGLAASLDPQPGFEEFRGIAAVQPNGETLLTWTRQDEPGGPLATMAATLEPDSGQLGSLHEWGPGSNEEVVPLASGYLALREDLSTNPNWKVQFLDPSGQPVGDAVGLVGYNRRASAHSSPDGGAVVIASGVSGTGGLAQAWRFGPDGRLSAGPVTLVGDSHESAVGTDAAGNLVVAWNDRGSRLFARRFSPDLQPLGPVLNVALGGARGIRVAVAADGRFVVLFVSSSRLYARAYRANGTVLGAKRLVAAPSDFLAQEDFDVAVGDDGRILAFWKAYQNSSVPALRARALGFDGRPLTKVLRVIQARGGRSDLLHPSVASLPGGDFLLLWGRLEADGTSATLQSRRFAGR